MPLLTEIEAAMKVRMSPQLLRWFTQNAPKFGINRKLKFVRQNSEYFYDKDELISFDRFLKKAWPHTPGKRPRTPVGIREEIKIESHCECAVCHNEHSGNAAHIKAVSKSHNNHPHNLIWLCQNHHTSYDRGYKTHSTLDGSTIRFLKKTLLNTQVRKWRIEHRAIQSLLLLTNDIDSIRTALQDQKLVVIHPALLIVAEKTIERLRENALERLQASPDPEQMEQITEDQEFTETIADSLREKDFHSPGTLNEVVDDIVEARNHYLEDTGSIECPLCKGSGYHRSRVCPICEGDGAVDKEDIGYIDLSGFEDEECPLCKGSGYHRSRTCPICEGDGAVDKEGLDHIDLSEYE